MLCAWYVFLFLFGDLFLRSGLMLVSVVASFIFVLISFVLQVLSLCFKSPTNVIALAFVLCFATVPTGVCQHPYIV